MRNYFAFYSPTYLLLFVAFSLMWSCEQEAALQDFEAVPDEMEIAARKAPPIDATPPPPCSGCRLTVTSMNIDTAVIEVQSILAGQLFDPPVLAYVCSSSVLWLSGTVNASSLPASIELADNIIDFKNLQFRARTFNIPSTGFTYTISCSGSSTFGGITSDPITWETGSAVASIGWDFRFPSSFTGYYSCPTAPYCGIGL